VFFTRSACSHGARKPPSPFPTRVDQVLSHLTITSLILPSVALYYPRWASIDVPRELQAGKSNWMSESHSIGVG